MESSTVSDGPNIDTCELDLDIWLKRWLALDEITQVFKSYLDGIVVHGEQIAGRVGRSILRQVPFVKRGVTVSETRDRALTLLRQVEKLEDFAEGQFAFFYDGFGEGTKYALCPDAADFPCDHVFWLTIDQITSDLVVIQEALAGAWKRSDLQFALEMADEYALSALEPVKTHLFSENGLQNKPPEYVTYFEKLASIRVTPYVPVSLITVPLTATFVRRDYLNIAHEIGHYVYWRGMVEHEGIFRPIYRALYEELERELGNGQVDGDTWECVKQWREEIFADVYSCLIAGPVIALSSQDLALQYSFLGFAIDDGVHPVPFLRPYIYTKVLERMNFNQSRDVLEDRWVERVNMRRQQYAPDPPQDNTQYLQEFTPAGCGAAIEDDDALDVMNAVVDIIYDFLQTDEWSDTSVWSNNLTAGESPDILYERFETRDVTDAMKTIPKRKPQGRKPETIKRLWNDWAETMGIEPTSAPPIIIEPGTIEDVFREPNGTWKPVLYAGGWTTKIGNHGPGG